MDRASRIGFACRRHRECPRLAARASTSLGATEDARERDSLEECGKQPGASNMSFPGLNARSMLA